MEAKRGLWWLLVQVLRAEKTDDKTVSSRRSLYSLLDGDAWEPIEKDKAGDVLSYGLTKDHLRTSIDLLTGMLAKGEQAGSIAFQLDELREKMQDELRAS